MDTSPVRARRSARCVLDGWGRDRMGPSRGSLYRRMAPGTPQDVARAVEAKTSGQRQIYSIRVIRNGRPLSRPSRFRASVAFKRMVLSWQPARVVERATLNTSSSGVEL